MSQFIVEVVERPADTSVVLAPELTEAARKFAAESKAENTRKAYRSDWRLFKAWCDAQGGAALPAEPSHTAAYLADLAGSARVSTVMRRAASIASGHRAAGHLSPVSSEVVKAVLRGIRRSKGVAQQGKRPTLTGDIKALVRAMGDGLLDKRDAALLLVGFGAALRRSELVWLDVADVQFRDEGALLTLRRSKTDQTGEGREVPLLFGSNPRYCPVRRLRQWIDVAALADGPLFRRIDRHGRLHGRLTAQSVALVIKKWAAAAGRNSAELSGHSLRAGHITSAAAAGATESSIAATSGHKSVAVLRRYIRHASLFTDPSAAHLGL